MNKQHEEKLFKYIYGEFEGWEVIPSESPDFICNAKGNSVLGVEVTEVYHDESDARLKNIENYTLDLLSGGDYRHKDDKENIKVQEVVYKQQGDHDGKKINAIVRDMLGFDDCYKLLEKAISSKEMKISSYLERCSEIDLIINDASGLFRFKEFKEFIYSLSFYSNNRINNSQFREIFLVTTKQIDFSNQIIVKIPLKLSLFSSEFIVIESVLRKHDKFNQLIDNKRIFYVLVFCLYRSGYENISIVSEDGKIGFLIANCLFFITSKGKDIREYKYIPNNLPNFESIGVVIKELNNDEIDISMQILEERKKHSGCIELAIKVENV